jgi:Trk-type K+ transport system membrane component
MVAVLTLIIIAMVSLLAVRTGATALMMTGLSWDAANFQSYSAFFGVGFTTREDASFGT